MSTPGVSNTWPAGHILCGLDAFREFSNTVIHIRGVYSSLFIGVLKVLDQRVNKFLLNERRDG